MRRRVGRARDRRLTVEFLLNEQRDEDEERAARTVFGFVLSSLLRAGCGGSD